jgi:hypothetical protein
VILDENGKPQAEMVQVDNTGIVVGTISQTYEIINGQAELKTQTTKLGTPSYDTEPTAQQLALGGIDTWEKSWDVGEYSIMATYDIKTKEITDLFFGADTDAAFKQFEDTNNILAAGNLSTSDPKYSVEFVKAKNGPGYTGAVIREK